VAIHALIIYFPRLKVHSNLKVEEAKDHIVAKRRVEARAGGIFAQIPQKQLSNK
jgi:hypothetical protein